MSIAWPDPSPAPPPPPPAGARAGARGRGEAHPQEDGDVGSHEDPDRHRVGLFAFLVWNDMADNPIIPFRDALRETAPGEVVVLRRLRARVVRQIHYVICEHSTRYNMFWEDKVFGRFNKRAETDEPVDALPHLAGAQVRVRQRRAVRLLRRPVGRHADRGVLPGAVADLRHPLLDRAGSAVHLPDRHAARPRGRPVRRDLLVPVARRRRHLLPRRHQDPVLRRVGPGPGARAGQRERDVPRGSREDREQGRPRAVAASCCGGRPAPARRSWPRRSPARPASRSSSSTPARSRTCSSGSASSR